MSKSDFPIFQQKIHGKPLVYLDNASSTQKPQVVIDSIQNFYAHNNANIHRGVHTLSERATQAYELARQSVQRFLHAKDQREIIFTRGVTESINLVASSFGRLFIKAGDEILISEMEHHSNIVPWQIVCEQTGAKIKVIPLYDDGSLDIEAYARLLTSRTRLVALMHVSNVLGTVNPVKQMIHLAHQQQIPVLLDGAQSAAHLKIDVQDLDCDFYTFSSHKLYGPTGLGVLYGKSKWLEKMPPYQGGGAMIKRVSFAKTDYADFPNKFEAGTPHISGAIGLQAAIEYIEKIGFPALIQHEQQLTHYTTLQLQKIPGLRIIGTTAEKTGVFSFIMPQAHPHDIATVLDSDGIAVRAGHHCAMPLMERFAVPATTRISLGIYNTEQDIDCAVNSLRKVIDIFS